MKARSAVQEARELLAHPRIDRMVGGRRGMLDGGLPPMVLLLAHRGLGPLVGHDAALRWAGLAAGLAAVSLLLLRRRQGAPLRQAALGLGAVSVAAVCGVLAGQARAFFLPGIVVDATYAVVLTGSVVVGRPLAGIVLSRVTAGGRGWRADRQLRRRYALVTAVWASAYLARALTTGALYQADQPQLLAVAKLSLGWPLTVACLAATIVLLRKGDTAPGARTA